MKEIINSLNKNPLFNFSLGSKELFHSNFIAWLLKCDMQFSELLLKNMGLIEIDNEIVHLNIQREKKNFDLLIEIQFTENSSYILIENKIKSLPYESQLNDYHQKFINDKDLNASFDSKMLLLTLTDPDFDIPHPWMVLSYKNFADALDNTINNFNKNVTIGHLDLRSVVKSYCDFLSSLIKIIDVCSKSDHYDYYHSSTAELSKFYSDLKEIRIYDLILKYNHQRIEKEIRDRIEKDSELQWKLIQNENEFNEVGEYVVKTDFSRSTGITDLKVVSTIVKNVPLILGIQLQGNMLKFLVKVPLKSSHSIVGKNINIAKELLESELWLHKLNFLNKNLKLKEFSSRGKGRRKEHGFCEYYKGAFLYKYDILDEGNSIKSIVLTFLEVAKYIENNKGAINNVVNSHFNV
jgi:hypothetical protein